MCVSDSDLVCDKCRAKQDEIFSKLQHENPDYTVEDERKAREEWYRSLCESCRKILIEEGFIDPLFFWGER